ncbi:hypothetical protein M655_025120 [Brevibacillus sp. NSP2.1]|uniref:hypothetical protein n=1 Tax=Brevibacillus sp. NSP2.1 TaxID=3003229 RepID=UPI0004796599|nr:hypothetical protein [Brevibacillus sp. NSP2.1]QHZ58652.1 hypothetical protein M655_025120 [Brevibacillus sp. NSP2.1]
MPCKLCIERGKPWKGDDPRCAFENGTFSPDNWNCATMIALREISREIGTNYRDDNAVASIGTVPFEGGDYSGYIVMTWYKDRGRTSNAFIAWDSEPIRELTEADAILAIEYNRQEWY